MPNRILREGINDSKAINSLSIQAEVFYRRLMSVVDDYGRFEADPELLRGELFKRQLDRWDIAQVEECLRECSETRNQDGLPLIMVYQIGNRIYLEIQNFDQRIRSSKSKYPAPRARQALCVMRGEVPPPADICPSSDSRVRPIADNGGHLHASRARAQSESYASAYAESYASASASAEPPRPPAAPPPELLAAEPPPVPDLDQRFERLYGAHIVPGWKQDAQYAYAEIVGNAVNPRDVADAIDRRHAEWMRFFTDNPGEYRPGLGKWFHDGYFTRAPVAAKGRDSPKRRLSTQEAMLERAAELAREEDAKNENRSVPG